MDVSELGDIAAVVGRGLVRAGSWLGGQVAAGYRAVDPDVLRHLAQTPLLALTLLAPRRGLVDPGVPDGHPPLVLVHGLGGNRGNLLPLAWYLRLHGRKRSYCVHFEPPRVSVDAPTDAAADEAGGPAAAGIPALAAALARFVEDVKAATGAPEVDLVAHSLGGIVARLALLDHGLAGSVRTLVTLGTPHQGTHPARYANTPCARDLRLDSPLVARLRTAGWPEGVRGVTFWSRNDLFVLPAESATVPGAEAVDLTPFTHYSYLVDPRAWVAVARALAG
jgi:triacylglycerol esterase/lipase EstA (alpha/beta hydrolase family)